MSKSIFFIELLLFHGLLLGFLFWELRKTTALQKKTEADAKAGAADAATSENASAGGQS